MSQGIQSTNAGIGGTGYNALLQPAVGRPPAAAPSVAQQLNRLQQSNQTSQQILPPSFQDYFENAAPEKVQSQKIQPKPDKPVAATVSVEEKQPAQVAQKSADTQSLPLQKNSITTGNDLKQLNGQAYYQELAPLIKDVQHVAQNSGYVDVRAEDVMRAYAQGSSLLADYSV